MTGNLNKILYDPVSYISKERLHVHHNTITTRACRALLNEIILEMYGIDNDSIPEGYRYTFWIDNWYFFSATAFLIGCDIHRKDLMWRGRFLSLPDWAKNYVENSPVKMSSIKTGHDATLSLQHQILSSGYLSIVAHANKLPEAFVKRFNLMFPSIVIKPSSTSDAINVHLLQAVIHYVKTHTITYKTGLL